MEEFDANEDLVRLPGAAPGRSLEPARTRLVVGYLGVFVVARGTALALALGAPAFGVLVGAGAWLLQRLVAVADRRAIVRAAEPGSRLGLNFIDAFARIWLLAAGIIVAGTTPPPPPRPPAAPARPPGRPAAFPPRHPPGRGAGAPRPRPPP